MSEANVKTITAKTIAKTNVQSILSLTRDLVGLFDSAVDKRQAVIDAINKNLPTGTERIKQISGVYNFICANFITTEDQKKYNLIGDDKKTWSTQQAEGLTKEWKGNTLIMHKLCMDIKNRVIRAFHGEKGAIDKGQLVLVDSGVVKGSDSNKPKFNRAKFITNLGTMIKDEDGQFTDLELEKATELLELFANPDNDVDTITCPSSKGEFGIDWDDLKACDDCEHNADCKESMLASQAD